MQITAPTALIATLEHGRLLRIRAGIFVLPFIILLCLPGLLASRSQLGSDESLYLSEAISLSQGNGLTYATGEPIVHRAPLYPALLAAAFETLGTSLETAYVLPRLAIVVNALLAFYLARAIFGVPAGIVTGILTASSAFLRGLGTTMYLDGIETFFILASLLALWQSSKTRSVELHALAGLLLGLAFLVKESAVLFLPLALLLSLTTQRQPHWRAGLLAWGGAFAVVAGWWWIWVFIQDGTIFLAGRLHSTTTLATLCALAAGLCCILGYMHMAGENAAPGRVSRAAAAAITLLWGAAFLYGLDTQAWDFDSDYLTHAPTYFVTVFASNVQPAVLVAAAWVGMGVAAWRGSRAGTFLSLSLFLFAPFVLAVSDRGLALRDLLPVVYLSYVALGGLVAWLLTYALELDSRHDTRRASIGVIAAAVLVIVAVVLPKADAVTHAEAIYPDDWQNGLTEEVAAWLNDNLPAGTPVMSTRLYYSQVYYLSNGRYPVFQLPTAEIQINRDLPIPVQRRSSLFRWEDQRLLADSPDDQWLYITRYPYKGYLVGLAERDLLTELDARSIQYLLITTPDAGFSPTALVPYFDSNSAFSFVVEFDGGQSGKARIYRVDRSRLAQSSEPLRITPQAYDYLRDRGLIESEETGILQRINPAGFIVTAP